MYMNRQRLAAAIALTLPALSQATPFSIFEARGFAMGGAGVASSEHAAASLYNPALLAAPSETDRFSFILPAVGVRASGTDGSIQAAMDLNDHNTIDKLTAAADAFTAAYNLCRNTGCNNDTALKSASGQVADASVVARDDLGALSGKSYIVNAGAVAAIALPKWAYKGALSLNVEFYGKATPVIASQDLTDLGTVISGARNYQQTGNPTTLLSFYDPTTGELTVGSNGNYQSKFNVVGVAVSDIGLSMAKRINVGEQSLLLGLTPKIQQVNSVVYTADVNNTDFDLNKNKKTDAGFNVDVGLAKTFGADSPYEKLRLGLVVRNLIPRTYKTSDPAQDIKMAPQVRVGAAWTGKYGTITSDLDLTANKIIGTGTDASQVFAIGGELNAWNVVKLRAGYRNDIKAKYGAVTAGVSVLGVQLSAAYAKDRELAAMLQFGASF